MRLIAATKNHNKVKEMRPIFAAMFNDRVEVHSIAELPWLDPWPEVLEDRATFEGNAMKKAYEFALHAGHTVLAEDSGLIVDALDGAPGVHSARFAGLHGDDDANNAALARALQHADAAPPYHARYVAVVALAIIESDSLGEELLALLDHLPSTRGEPGAQGVRGEVELKPGRPCTLAWWRGVCEGEIVLEPRGEGGFGYDAHFFVPQFGATMAQVSREQKGQISHRRRALDALKDALSLSARRGHEM